MGLTEKKCRKESREGKGRKKEGWRRKKRKKEGKRRKERRNNEIELNYRVAILMDQYRRTRRKVEEW